nr:substrate-binding domain-containing protein [Neptunomonas qingdaonensis]
MDSCHGGLLTDRLILAGSDDPLLQAVAIRLTQQLRAQALFSYTVTGTTVGLELLAQGHADACVIHWGRAEESEVRHPALIQQYNPSKNWILVHLFCRSQGLIVRAQDQSRFEDPDVAMHQSTRWVIRQQGAGSQRFLKEWLMSYSCPIERLTVSQTAYSEREMVSMIATGEADIGPGTLSAAKEFGLGFIPVCEESFDLVVPRGVYFRRLLQQLFEFLQGPEGMMLANRLQGYNLNRSGRLLWNADGE